METDIVHIALVGPTASGKTTYICAIANVLEQLDIRVEIVNPELVSETIINFQREILPKFTGSLSLEEVVLRLSDLTTSRTFSGSVVLNTICDS